MKCICPTEKFNKPDMFDFVIRVAEREAQQLFADGSHKFVPKRIKTFADWEQHKIKHAERMAASALLRAQRKEAMDKHREMCRELEAQNAKDVEVRKQEAWNRLQNSLRRKPKYYATKEDQLKNKAQKVVKPSRPRAVVRSRRSNGNNEQVA